jgi:Fur family ferric uptake transcriptional regulator
VSHRPPRYATRQGAAILSYIQQHQGSHVTAAQIIKHFEGGEAGIGRTTVYRQLEKLVQAGKVRKFSLDENNGAVFQYVGECGHNGEHLHLKCEDCGLLIHVDKAMTPRLAKGMLAGYNFELDTKRTVIYGHCQSCHDNQDKPFAGHPEHAGNVDVPKQELS